MKILRFEHEADAKLAFQCWKDNVSHEAKKLASLVGDEIKFDIQIHRNDWEQFMLYLDNFLEEYGDEDCTHQYWEV